MFVESRRATVKIRVLRLFKRQKEAEAKAEVEAEAEAEANAKSRGRVKGSRDFLNTF